ncbi:hypothetical protein ECG_00419 [Echinococcus granulosus]|uniref:GGDEF domain-containing protein n=1 Tax=Echinococcus granulosus TaxID=6210 RepID=A0A068WYL7_ECHGR|nr:hypothetical protein ECG_00419 [Echinococcus granulosus]CDS23591.1 hypothetical protein EgrG_002043200 [Echinococcus granulosus]
MPEWLVGHGRREKTKRAPLSLALVCLDASCLSGAQLGQQAVVAEAVALFELRLGSYLSLTRALEGTAFALPLGDVASGTCQ